MFATLDPENTGFINFSSYIFLRREHLAWKKCGLDDKLSVKSVSCAVYITCPTRPLGLPDANKVFETAMSLDFGYGFTGA
jgi:hypothetical protein